MPLNKMPQYLGKDWRLCRLQETITNGSSREFLLYIGKSVAEVGAGVGSF